MTTEETVRRRVKSLSEAEFRACFGTEEQCRQALFAMRWKDGLTCPVCGHGGFCALTTRRVFQCNRCKKQISLTAGTVFQDSKLPLTSWFVAIYHLTQSKGGISSVELGRRLGVKQATAWLLKHKLMQTMLAREAGKPKLTGRIEVDDAYLGGERSGGKRGRGSPGKTPFVAAVETSEDEAEPPGQPASASRPSATRAPKPRRLRLTVVTGFRKKEVAALAKRDFTPGSRVLSDGLSCWTAVTAANCTHEPMVTGSGKPAAQHTRFKWVNTTLGNIKTALAGTYHHVSPQHAQRYLASFAYRFNRRFQLDSIVERLAWAAMHTAPQPYAVIIADG
jgi:transposase-like protein